MTGVELSDFICLYYGFCQFSCPYNMHLPLCFDCKHQIGYVMYFLGLDMLETGDNPLI